MTRHGIEKDQVIRRLTVVGITFGTSEKEEETVKVPCTLVGQDVARYGQACMGMVRQGHKKVQKENDFICKECFISQFDSAVLGGSVAWFWLSVAAQGRSRAQNSVGR